MSESRGKKTVMNYLLSGHNMDDVSAIKLKTYIIIIMKFYIDHNCCITIMVMTLLQQ